MTTPLRFHCIGLPHTEPTDEYSWCAHTQKSRRFTAMMKSLGHDVTLYSGIGMKGYCPPYESRDSHWRAFTIRVAGELQGNAKPGDFLCLTGGDTQEPLAHLFPELTTVEYGVGYGGAFAPYRVYESHAWRHTIMGARAGRAVDARGGAADCVIPLSCDPDQFTAGAGSGDEKGPYLLFVGRLMESKGVRWAVETANRTGMRLVVAGNGDRGLLAGGYNVDYRGVVQPAECNRLMGAAVATLVPTLYVEPFGAVAVESQFTGTPVISTDWGAFTETVIHGFTGFRCRTVDHMVAVVPAIRELNRAKIRERALAVYSTEVVKHQYDHYFRWICATRPQVLSLPAIKES